MLRNRVTSVILLTFLSLGAIGQYGNEWIDYNQSYFKLKVVEDGLYRVTAAELQAAGFPLSTVPSNRLQLFRRGVEVAIQVSSSGGVLDYLEFYGLKNTGVGDRDLFIETDAQPHDEYNLFTDTAAYFLTWKLTNESGKRMGLSTLNDASGLTPESYHLAESLTLGKSDYAPGIKFGSGSSFSLSDYDYGEGWTGNFISKGSAKEFNLSLDNYENSGENPLLELVIVGGNTLSHNVDIEVGPDPGSLRNIGNVQFSNRTYENVILPFSHSDIGASGELILRIITTGFSGASDRVSTALVRVVYPQSLDMATSENKKFALKEIPSGDRAYVRIATTNASGTAIYDITNSSEPIRIVSTNFSNRLECIVPGPETNRKLFAVTNPLTIANIQQIDFQELDISSDYLIVTHPALRLAASDGLDPIQAFADYRGSVQGGEYSSIILNFFDVVNQFNYGDVSPIAIRRLVDYALNNGSPQALFLIGKGRTPDFNFYRNSDHSVVNVPTYGDPGGDLMFSSGLGLEPYAPALATGRLSAYNSEHVKSYVDKIKEQEALPYDNLNRKNALQLSGGQSASELSLFSIYIQQFEQVLEGDFLGGKAINYGKKTADNVEVVDVVKEINDGVGLVTFFGHSGRTVTDIEIGKVSDGQFGYQNQGKYPVFLVNGCNAGDIFGSSITSGEDWMRTPNLGAIGYIAHADFAASSALKRYSDIFYDVAFAREASFGSSLGEIIKECSRQYLESYTTSNLSQTQALQVVLQGDPMVKVFGADRPDYEITSDLIWAEPFEGDVLLAAQDSFKINMIVRNYGRTVSDSLIVQSNRTLPDGSSDQGVQRFLRPLRSDTLVFTVYNDFSKQLVGTNTFQIILDPLNNTEELNETNNQAIVTFDIFQGNTANLYPPDFGISTTDEIQFYWQPTDVFEALRGYELQIDTVASFDSPYFQSIVETGEKLLSTNVDFSGINLPDTTTFYWRTRFENPMDEVEEEWEESSFTMIKDGVEGWGQFERDQAIQGNLVGVEYPLGTDQWQFITTDSPLDIQTFGVNYPDYNYADLRVIASGIDYLVTANPIDPRCAGNTINAIVFDKESTNPYRPIAISGADVFNRLVCGRLPQMVYNFTQADVVGSNAYLETLITNMSTGDHVLLFNIGNVNYSAWDADVLNSLETIGISSGDISSLTDGQPLIVLGRKGDTPGTANIVVGDGSPDPVEEQTAQLMDNVLGSFTSGHLTTGRIGPAVMWDEFTYQIAEQVEDAFEVRILGITADGIETDLFSFARTETQSLSSIDASQYPWLKIRFSFSDDTDLTPPQFDFWQITYQKPPEGILLSDRGEQLNVFEGQPVEKEFMFYNYSNVDFSDSLDISASLINNGNGKISIQQFGIKGPISGDTTKFQTSVGTIGQDELNNMIVEAIARENEQYTFNNRLNLPNAINVQADNTNPILDVTFDGLYIMNGDIVSPNPTILIRMRDDNAYLLKSDTTGFAIQLKESCEGCTFNKVNFSDPSVTYSLNGADFEITYTPGPLEDGTYTLSVQARDESDNPAGDIPYEVEFEVVSASSITHFYPYPNPFSTQTRFVFTLTGDVIPEKIKIQIMTISGRIVREINQNEIGAIKIGNNITDFAWDGTDEYGDQLANGVYFYRVVMESGEKFDQRSTSADGAFKNGFGKLYILR